MPAERPTVSDILNMPTSPEGQAMQAAERKKWLTIAEGQRIRQEWESLRSGMDKALEKYDENPENETEGLMLVVVAGLISNGFASKCANAARTLQGLQ